MKRSRFFKIITASVLCLSLTTGCLPNKSENKSSEAFNEFLATLPTRFISNDDMNLEFIFEHPENYGFTPELLNLPFSDLNDYKDSEKDGEAIVKELEQYDYDALSDDQKITYDILKDNLTRSQGVDEFYYLDNSYLGSFVGFQAQLPLLLNEYTFETEQDLNSYFNILATSDETFQKYAELEKERQEKGVGMSKAILDKVIEQCVNFSKDEDTFLIESINEKIDALSFLDDAQKSEAKSKNEELLRNQFVSAYKNLGDSLSTIDASDEDKGLADLPKGKEYYAYLLKKNTGIDDSVEDVKKYLKDHMDFLEGEMKSLAKSNMQAYAKLLGVDLNNLEYSKFESFEETLDYLGERMKEDYPDAGKLVYDITIVPESMKDNFSPAAYLQGKIDAPADAPEHIWVNGDYEQSLFSTLAHEGYPGHMYQHTYFKQQEHPTIRYIIDYNGYSEGWATYIENASWKYADVSEEDKVLLHFASINQQLTQCIIGLMDIGVHYDGWSYEEYTKQMGKYFDVDAMGDSLKEQYYLILETPTNYLQYYLTAAKFQDMYNSAQKALGDKFDAIEFNEVLLKTGPAPMSILQTEVDKYIEDTK